MAFQTTGSLSFGCARADARIAKAERLILSFSHPRFATLYEQAVIAATGFLSMLFFARHLPRVEWATFSFAVGLMFLVRCAPSAG